MGKSKSNHQIKSDGYGHAVDIFPCGVIENGEYRKFTSAEGYDEKKIEINSKSHIRGCKI